MELRFPAPSSNDRVPPVAPTAGEVPSTPHMATHEVGTPGLRRGTEGAMQTAVVPNYRPPGAGPVDAGTAAGPAAPPPPSASAGPAPASPGGGDPGSPTPPGPKGPKLRPRRAPRTPLRHVVPAWLVSLLVHVVILSALAAATLSAQDADKKPVNFDSALAGYRQGEREELNIWADPQDVPRDQAVGKEHGGGETPPMEAAGDTGDDEGGGTVVAATFGGGVPSATPRFRGTGKKGINEGNSLPNFKVEGLGGSPLSMLPAAPAADLYGGGMIAGDPVFDVKEIGAALDQLAREILRHLKDHKLTVVWLFDESSSMADDQRSIHEKFDRVSSELKKNIETGKKSAGALNHAIVGFGQGMDFVLKKPTLEIDEIGRAIRNLRVDMTGVENTMGAITHAIDGYSGLIGKDRKMLLVLVTDESGDDGADVEEARQALKKYKVPLYVIGRQSLFGYPFAHHRYVDPVTKDVYHPVIRRGPETADVEAYQWDGLYDRWDEQPSGFAPWELARLSRESGGLYFLLPSEEFMRIRQREQAYSIVQLKEYMPEYDNRMVYVEKRNASELRRSLYQIITESRGLVYRRDFPIDSAELVQAAAPEVEKAGQKLEVLLRVEEHLQKLKGLRDREPERRWQAHYDLILAQTVAFQVKAFEYRALMSQIVQRPPSPSKQSTPDLTVAFVVDHNPTPVAPRELTAKKYAQAKQLLEEVIAKHPRTPWADLAQDTLNRGFSVKLNEWHHNPKYAERAEFVPKY